MHVYLDFITGEPYHIMSYVLSSRGYVPYIFLNYVSLMCWHFIWFMQRAFDSSQNLMGTHLKLRLKISPSVSNAVWVAGHC